MSQKNRPLFVVIGGAAASGKTTLAARLAKELRLPLLSRDGLKEPMMDALGAPDRMRSQEIGAASYAVLYTVMALLLEAGVGAVIESNFSHGLAETDLRKPISRACAVQIHCETTPEEIRRRYRDRAASGDRHPGHHDADEATLADLETSLAGNRHQPLDLAIPLLRVDTSDGYTPSFPEILRSIVRLSFATSDQFGLK